MLTQILGEASSLMSSELLVDSLTISSPGINTVVNFEDIRSIEPRVHDVPCLVQTTSVIDSDSGTTSRYFSVKVGKDEDLNPGDYVTITRCDRDQSLVGRSLLIDNVSYNGIALIKKGISKEFENVNSEGKSSAR